MIGDTSANFDVLTLSEAELVDQACDRFETAWRGGDWPCIEGYLDAVTEPCRLTLLHELIKLELELRMKVGELPTAEEYRLRFPDRAHAVDEIFREVIEPAEVRSTLPDNILGSAVPNPDAPTLDAPTLDLDPSKITELPTVDGALGRLFGDYVILDRLGSGGMGVVYRAFQRKANRMVALKLIKADWCGDSTELTNEKAEKHFRNEAQLLGGLEHDHIVPLYDVGQAEGVLFFSMRLIKGRSLGQIILSDGPLPARRAAYYVEAVARAIQYAHENKVMHRDLKPGNIMLDENDRPYLIDLGLARSLEATDYTTVTGRPLGTAAYMSPEQARGANKIGFGTDVYGLGATLFTLLTGRPPFTGPDALVVLRKVIDEEPAWPRERDKPVGVELKAICLKCLDKTPGKRFGSAGELAMVLKKYLNYESTGVTLPRPWTRLAKWVRRQPWRAAAAVIALVAILTAGSAGAWIVQRNRMAAELFLHDLHKDSLNELPARISRMASYRGWIDQRLRELLRALPPDTESRTRVLLALLPSEPELASALIDRLLTCEPAEHRVIRESLRSYWPLLSSKLRHVFDDPRSSLDRRTRAAAALIGLDGPTTPAGRTWSELRLAKDPGPRVELLDWLVRSSVDPDVLVAHLESEPDPSIRLILIQCLADLGVERPAQRSPTHLARLLVLYREDPDPGVHSSVAYLLRLWGHARAMKDIDAELVHGPQGLQRWYVNSQGHTMAIIGGKDDLACRLPGHVPFPYRFAIATTETTLGQYLQFKPNHQSLRDDPGWKPLNEPDAPADLVSYNAATAYCNWLSQKEGLPESEWCYLPDSATGRMVLASNYILRKGYRLPNLEEWEYAARAGTTTARYCGDSPVHIREYAWNKRNSIDHAERVGLKRPNDFGLSDILGNLFEWCYNPKPPHNAGCNCGASDGANCREKSFAAERGGSFELNDAGLVARPTNPIYDLRPSDMPEIPSGFRVAKSQQ